MVGCHITGCRARFVIATEARVEQLRENGNSPVRKIKGWSILPVTALISLRELGLE
jgi:hypothetical protein